MPKEEETETATSAHQSTDTGADAPRTRRTSSANLAEEKLEKILKANKRANLKVHEQEDRIMEELAMGMAVIDRKESGGRGEMDCVQAMWKRYAGRGETACSRASCSCFSSLRSSP